MNYNDDFESSNKTSNFDDVGNDFGSFNDPTKSDNANQSRGGKGKRQADNISESSDDSEINEFDDQINQFKTLIDDNKDVSEITESIEDKPKPKREVKKPDPKPTPASKKREKPKPIGIEESDSDSIDDNINEFDEQINQFKGLVDKQGSDSDDDNYSEKFNDDKSNRIDTSPSKPKHEPKTTKNKSKGNQNSTIEQFNIGDSKHEADNFSDDVKKGSSKFDNTKGPSAVQSDDQVTISPILIFNID